MNDSSSLEVGAAGQGQSRQRAKCDGDAPQCVQHVRLPLCGAPKPGGYWAHPDRDH